MSGQQRVTRGEGRDLMAAAILIAALSVVAGALAAQPIYDTAALWLVGTVASAIACVVVWLGLRLRWGPMTLVALAVAFVVIIVPLGVPSALGAGPAGLLRGLGDGLAAVALGWKQLLTLSLPVGSYQAVLVPFITVIFVSVAASTALILRTKKWRVFAALALVAPVLFGAIFGSSAVSNPANIGGIAVSAPRELVLWLGTFGAAVAWVAWSSGRERRAALRRGRQADAVLDAEQAAGDPHGVSHSVGRRAVRRNAVVRGVVAGAVVCAAVGGALVLAPIVTDSVRTVPRDAIDPDLVVRDRVSPLAAYRTWKRDAMLKEPLFNVTSANGELPSRLGIAVLSGYDGVDFTVGDPALVGRFTRFPSGVNVDEPREVTLQIAAGYQDVWVPISAPLASPPRFTGERSAALSDSFYLNRDSGSAVVVSADAGLRPGDTYTVVMSGTADATLGNDPMSRSALIDLSTMPQLARWLDLQALPATGDGVIEAVQRLRDRGYLSHSLTDGNGEGQWVSEQGAKGSIRFVSSPGGHSEARLEQLFQQLADQQVAVGTNPSDEMLVAGIGDDEQFAAAAALIARAMGFESRVVVGVRLGGESAGVPGTPACADVCAGENIAAWIEVRGRDGVWAPLDASPQTMFAPTMLQKGEQLPEFPTQPEERNANESDPPLGMINQEGGEAGETETDSLGALLPVLRVIGLSFVGVALLALLVLFLPLVKLLRARQRRDALTPEVQVLGAWDELLDAYSDSGAHPTQQHGREAVMHELGIDGGDWIAWTVDQAVYSREGVTPEVAQLLWEVVDVRVAEHKRALGFWQRVRSRFSLASFGRRTDGVTRMSTRRKKKEALR